MKQLLIKPLLILLFFFFISTSNQAQTLVRDQEHVQTSAVEAYAASVSTSIKALLENGLIEKIAKVQTFFKTASEFISKVVTNLKMTQQLIDTEQDIQQLFRRSLERLDRADDFEGKWKHRWILSQLFLESTQVFEVFDLTIQKDKGLKRLLSMDDKGRIDLIKQTLQKAKAVKKALVTATRRANRQIYQIKRQQKELEVFTNLFDS